MNHRVNSLRLFMTLGIVTTVGIFSNYPVKAEKANSIISDNYFLAQNSELSPGEQANADFRDKITGASLLDALQKGGHVIYF